MRRREFIRYCGAAVALGTPNLVRAQPASVGPRIGVLMDLAEADPEGQTRLRSFIGGLPAAASVEVKWAGGDPVRTKTIAAELVALGPDVILASGGPAAD